MTVADPQKMMVLLEFVIDTDGLVDCCRDEWLKIYDKEVGSTPGGTYNTSPVPAQLCLL